MVYNNFQICRKKMYLHKQNDDRQINESKDRKSERERERARERERERDRQIERERERERNEIRFIHTIRTKEKERTTKRQI